MTTIIDGIAERSGHVSHPDLPHNGRTVAKRIGSALGLDNPLRADALHAKFANCAGRVLPPAQVERLRQALLRFDEASSLRDVVAAIALSTGC